MNIHLLRHGIAAPLAEENDFRDEKRRLTPEGELKLRRAAQGLKLLQVSFDLIVSSPLIRAKETAEIVAEVLKYKPAIDIWDELEPEGTAESVCSAASPPLGERVSPARWTPAEHRSSCLVLANRQLEPFLTL